MWDSVSTKSWLNEKSAFALLNGPVSKTHFLEKKYLGITEYLAKKIKIKKKPTMLIYNSSFSVCPITTHLPIKFVTKNLTKKKNYQWHYEYWSLL